MNPASLRTITIIIIALELGGVAATIWGWLALGQSAAEADRLRFDKLTAVLQDDIEHRLGSYENVLYGAVGFLNGSEQVTSDEWRRYVASIPLQTSAKGLLGIGTIEHVPVDERPAYIAQQVADHPPRTFRYSTVNGVPPPTDLSYIINRIEPLEPNQAALGLDIASEANRREAAERALHTGEPTITRIIHLVQDDQKTPGFLLLISRQGATTPVGDLVYAPMIGDHVFADLVSPTIGEISLQIYDSEPSAKTLIYHSDQPHDSRPALIEEVRTFPYAGREWRLAFRSTEHFVSMQASGMQHYLLAFGLLLSAALAGSLYLIHRGYHSVLARSVATDRALAREQRINALFVKHAPAAVAIFDNNLCYLAASDRWFSDYGIEGQEIVGRHHYDVFPIIRQMPHWIAIHQRCLQGTCQRSNEDRMELPDGSVMWLRWEIHPWFEEDRTVGGIIMFTQAITAEVEGRLALEQAQQAAEAATVAKSQFLATMSHEIRTPLNGIIGHCELLQRTALSDDMREHVTTIGQCGETLLSLINDILDFSKIEAGALQLERQPFDPVDLTQQLVAVVQINAQAKGVELDHSTPEHCPRRVLGDPLRLRQVLLNLLSNAVKFTAAGTVTMRLAAVRDAQEVRTLVWTVADSGIGMSTEELQRCFAPFTQADASTARRFGGTGLGLSISKGLIEAMGGSLTATSTAGVGTTMTVRLPCHEADGHHGTTRHFRSSTTGALGSVKNFRNILVAEDNPVNQKLIRSQLGAYTEAVTVVDDGLQVIEARQTGDHDLILMDCQMPKLDGLEASRQIRAWERQQGVPPVIIIALTANAYIEDQEACLHAGMDDFLSKPIRREVLSAMLSKWSRKTTDR